VLELSFELQLETPIAASNARTITVDAMRNGVQNFMAGGVRSFFLTAITTSFRT
jgi:hypothetical protein